MPIVVKALPKADFDKWLADQQAAANPPPAPAPASTAAAAPATALVAPAGNSQAAVNPG